MPSQMSYKTKTSSDPSTIANLFAENFSAAYSAEQLAPPDFKFDYFLNPTLSEISVTESQVFELLRKLKADSSSGPDNIPPIILKNCASVLALPLSLLFNKSLRTGRFPHSWKTSFVIPIYKNGDKKDITNYRPICKSSAIPKLFECLIYNILAPILSPLLTSHQHGFVNKKSTTTNLLSFTDHINRVIDQGSQFDCILTDYSKAFDKININILCAKLQAYGVHDPLLTWFYSYFSDRTQLVKLKSTLKNDKCGCTFNSINNQITILSDPFEVRSGCPQGGHISGLAFDLFINDIYLFLLTEFWLFADDKKTGQRIDSINDAVLLQRSLDNLYLWCSINKMELNIKKCKVITFNRKKNPIIFEYKINGIPLERVYSLKDLGVTFDHKLCFNEHYDIITKRAYKTLGFINRNSKDFQNPKTYVLLYNAFIRSLLEYASPVWSPYYEKYKLKIERVQHRFLRNLAYRQGTPMSFSDHDYTEIMKCNNILSLGSRRDNNDIIFLYKILNELTLLPEIKENIRFRNTGRNTRNNDIFDIDFCSKNYTYHKPLNRMIRLFNKASSSDSTIHPLSCSINEIKEKLKKINVSGI